MAYAYDLTMQALGNGQDDENAGQSGAAVQASSAAAGGLTAGQGAPQQAGGTGAQTQGQSANMQSSTAGRNRLLDKNQGRVQSPVDVGALKGNIEGAQKGITDEADNYVKNAASLYDFNDNTRQRVSDYALKGKDPGLGVGEPLPFQPDNSTFAGAGILPAGQADWLTLFQGGARRVDPMRQSNLQTDFGQINDLSNDAGTARAFRQRGDAEYSAGEAALDTALLRRDPGFAQQRDQALRANDALQKQKQLIGGEAQNRAQAARDRAMVDFKGKVRSQLTTDKLGIEDKAKAEEARFDKILAESQTPEQRQTIIDAQMADLANDPNWWAPGQTAAGDTSKYFKGADLTADGTSWNDFLDKEQGESFGRIQSVLGGGGPISTGRLYGKNVADVGGVPTFDKAGFRTDMLAKNKAALDAKKAADAAQKAIDDAEFDKRTTPFENAYSSDMTPPMEAPTPSPGGKSVWEPAANPVQKAIDYTTDPNKSKFGGPWVSPLAEGEGFNESEANRWAKKVGIRLG